ncbi:hypothetical protein T4E_3625 [Trichinella pseudospiralis]|uniref:Uncharacterized protein n=4 Tax=Trichinella pseudospiralis TaxID=6337 RepID=A0A0V0Y0B0_TRIPS|nr:hypothetical protein T4E_3625 [Trichinella pseudospiralis]
MPKLMKGATPNELVKGVTANRMPIIGEKTEPDNKFTFNIITKLTVSLLESRSPLDWSLRQMRILIAKHNATDFTSLSIPSPNGQGHLLKIDPASTGATARRLSRGSSPLKGRGARGGAGAVELGLTLLLISLRRSSKAAGLWYRNRVRKSLPTASTPPSPRAGRHDFFRDDPQWIRKPDPPSTDRSLRSAEDAGSAPDGSFAPRMQIYPDSALPPAHTNCRHT